MKLWLVRHAAPQVAPGLCYGRTDVPADAAATRACASQLHGLLPDGIALWSSPLVRCSALARQLASERPGLQAVVDARLQELDFGAWELQPWDSIGRPALDAWSSDFGAHRPGGGESVDALLARVAAALADVQAARRDAAWITHAGVIRAAHVLLDGRSRIGSAAQWPQMELPFGCVVQLQLDRG